jgi:hypothetical protein
MSKRIFAKIHGLGTSNRKYNIQVSANLLTFEIVEFGEPVNNTLDLANPDLDSQQVIPYETVLEKYELSLETVKRINNLRSNELYSIVRPPISFDINVHNNHLVNMSHLTKQNRMPNPYSYVLPAKHIGAVNIFIKDLNGTFEDHDIIVYIPADVDDSNLTSNVDFDIIPYTVDDGFKHIDLLDTITATEDTSYTNDDYYKFNVSTETYVEEVFLEQVQAQSLIQRIFHTVQSSSLMVRCV